MSWQGGQVQLEQSNIRLALNVAKMAKEGFLGAATEETQCPITPPNADIRVEKKRRVQIPGHTNVDPAIERHPAMLRQKQTA